MDNLTTIPFSKIEARKIRWLLRPFIPRGFITLVAGDGGVGKSTVLIDIVARVTNGEPMPQFGEEVADPPLRGSALILCKEDSESLVIKPRLSAAGANMHKVRIPVSNRSSVPGDYEVVDSLDTGLEGLERQIQKLGDVRIILIDPITSFTGKFNFNQDDHVRRLLNPLSQLAKRYDIAIICVIHLNKDGRKSAVQRTLGGGGFVNVARTALFVVADGETRYLAVGKTNLWHEKKAVEFRMLNVEGQAQIEWGSDYENIDLEKLVAGKKGSPSKREEVGSFLRYLLSEGPMRATDIKDKLTATGQVHINTVKAAKQEVGILSEKKNDGWWWRLPRAE